LISVQASKKIDYPTFKNLIWKFNWDEEEVIEVPVIDWAERDRLDEERKKKTIKQEIMNLN
jgi:hypothetical protein